MVFPNGNSLLIFGVHQEPPTPRLLSATFSSDGSSIFLAFDSATSRGMGVAGGGSNFCNCSRLLQFQAIELATCRWADDATSLTIFPGSRGTVSVGSSVVLLGGVLQATCSLEASTACASWKYVASTRVAVASPAKAAPPAVIIGIPTTIGQSKFHLYLTVTPKLELIPSNDLVARLR